MSLAMYAAPFNESPINEDLNEENAMNKKRHVHNKTQRKMPKENFDTQKVKSVLDEIHNNNSGEDEDNNLGDFNPPPMPDSAGVNKTIATEYSMNLNNIKNEQMLKMNQYVPQPNLEDNSENYSLNAYKNNYSNAHSVDEYYKKILPGYDPRQTVNKPYYNIHYGNQKPDTSNHDVLLQKINFMINLLEEKQDEKTDNVVEEVILYSFLGIFIIFVVDSFARVGKYVR